MKPSKQLHQLPDASWIDLMMVGGIRVDKGDPYYCTKPMVVVYVGSVSHCVECETITEAEKLRDDIAGAVKAACGSCEL